ncbi:ferritin-like domain-containing protein [Gallibacterium anatis]|uniref:ferritin-like domain-containing protein n=1 Tax=Gallibacterium anatis TaxID=750 RepID=UPI0039FCB600
MNQIHQLLNEMLAVYWRALIQHRSHVGVIAASGANLLAEEMEKRIADEPETITLLQNRLLDLGGEIQFKVEQADIGSDLKSALAKDYALQKYAREGLNKYAEQAAAEHDATTRILIEKILEDEEEHLFWLEQELDLLDKLGEALYLSKRM